MADQFIGRPFVVFEVVKMKNNNKETIVIVGGGTAGWMTAAALSKLIASSNKKIVLIESEQIGTVGVGEATVPHLKFFNHKLGIDEDLFMEKCQATYKLGIEFANWNKDGSAYIHPFAELGEPLYGVPFHQIWMKYKESHPESSLSDYSLAIQACYANKFDFPNDDPSSIYSTYSYAYHIDATSYAAFLSEFAQQLGTQRIEGIVETVDTGDSGDIQRVILQDGSVIEGDFFIDCSGFRSLLLGQALNVPFEDWSEYLPCDRAIAAISNPQAIIKPYTRATAKEAGWQWQIPLTHKTGNGYVYSSKFLSQEDALTSFIKDVDGELTSEPNHLRFTTGKRQQSWKNNCVAIGLSSGFLEPLESTSIYLIQSAIMKLVELLPNQVQNQSLAFQQNEFNRYMDNDLIKIRDFLILHYHVTGREDTPFWQYCSNMGIPDSLAEKIELFKEFGHVVNYDQGMFLEPSWLAVYYGQGITPQNPSQQTMAIDPRVEILAQQGKVAQLGQLAKIVKQATASMTDHQTALNNVVSRRKNGKASDNRVKPTMNLYGRYSS